jgi:hypothetical protein
MAPAEWNGGTEGLRHQILREMAARVAPYGIVIEEVSLQEVRLPEEIVQQCIQACKAAYLPLIAQRKASKRHAELAAEVDLLGKEAVGTREVVKAAPGFALVDFVGNFLNKAMAHPDGIGLSAPLAGPLAAAPVVGESIK